MGAGGVPLSVVCLCLRGAVCHCQIQINVVIRSKNGEANVQVANVKYSFLSNDGHSVRFLHRYGKFMYLSRAISEMFPLLDV